MPESEIQELRTIWDALHKLPDSVDALNIILKSKAVHDILTEEKSTSDGESWRLAERFFGRSLRMPLRFHRSQAYGRSPQTARTGSFYLVPTLPLALAFRLLPYGLSVVALPIGEPLADDTTKAPLGALYIVNAEPNAVAVSEIALCQISMQVLLAAMLVDAFHAALEHGKEALRGVGMRVTPDIFVVTVLHGFVTGELAPDLAVPNRLIGHEGRFARDIGADDGREIGNTGAVYMKAASRAAALDKGENDVLMAPARTALGLPFLTADEGFVDLHRLARAAHWLYPDDAHGLTNAVRHKPRSLECDAQGSGELIAADPLLAGAKQIHRLQPESHGDMTVLENGFNLHSEGLTALVALVNTRAGAFALKLTDALGAAAVRADRSFRPNASLDPGVGRRFILEGFAIKHRLGHDASIPVMNQCYQTELGTSNAISRCLC
jgi:hypothetical protein